VITPTDAQVRAAVIAAHAAVSTMTNINIALFINETKFDALIASVLTAALNADAPPPPPPPNQPLAPT